MKTPFNRTFKHDYETLLQHLRLKGLQPKTIEAYSRAIRRIGLYFDHQLDDLSEQQLLDYFANLLSTHSWSAVKLDLYGLKFFYQHVLHQPWVTVDLIKLDIGGKCRWAATHARSPDLYSPFLWTSQLSALSISRVSTGAGTSAQETRPGDLFPTDLYPASSI